MLAHQGSDSLLETRNIFAAYFLVGNLHYCAFGSLRAFQLACLFWISTVVDAAWLVEVWISRAFWRF